MCVADGRHETLGNTVESVPRHFWSLASAHQCMSPGATDILAHAAQSIQIARHSVVVDVPLHHAIQPFAHNGHRLMPSSHQFCPDFCNLHSHSLLHRQTSNLEQALSVGTAAMRESEKVERFRLLLSPSFAVCRCKSTKLDQPRLRRVQGQPKFIQSLLHCGKETSGCFSILESEHTVIGIAHDNHISPCISATPLLRPLIEGVMQVDVRQ